MNRIQISGEDLDGNFVTEVLKLDGENKVESKHYYRCLRSLTPFDTPQFINLKSYWNRLKKQYACSICKKNTIWVIGLTIKYGFKVLSLMCSLHVDEHVWIHVDTEFDHTVVSNIIEPNEKNSKTLNTRKIIDIIDD